MSIEVLTESRPRANHATVKAWVQRTQALIDTYRLTELRPVTRQVQWFEEPHYKSQWRITEIFEYQGQQREVTCFFEEAKTDAGRAKAVALFESGEYTRAKEHAVYGWMARVDYPEIFASP